MTVTSSSLPTLDSNADLNQPLADSPPCIIDFFAGRDRLLEEIGEIKGTQTQQLRSVELFDPLEDWLYSLISAAALVSVLMGILCMASFAMPQMPGPKPERNSHTESLPITQKAG